MKQDHELERLAADMLEHVRCPRPVDACELAALFGLPLLDVLVDDPRAVYVDPSASIASQQESAAKSIATAVLCDLVPEFTGRAGYSEKAADYLAGALLLPAAELHESFESAGNKRACLRMYPNVSERLLRRRIRQVVRSSLAVSSSAPSPSARASA